MNVDLESAVTSIWREMIEGDRDYDAGWWQAPADQAVGHAMLLAGIARYSSGNAIEIGTDSGIGSLGLAWGTKPKGGRVWTFDVNPMRIGKARQRFERFGCGNVETIDRRELSLSAAVGGAEIGLVFVDGAHDYQNCLQDLIEAADVVNPYNGLILIDDFYDANASDVVYSQSEGNAVPFAIARFLELKGDEWRGTMIANSFYALSRCAYNPQHCPSIEASIQRFAKLHAQAAETFETVRRQGFCRVPGFLSANAQRQLREAAAALKPDRLNHYDTYGVAAESAPEATQAIIQHAIRGGAWHEGHFDGITVLNKVPGEGRRCWHNDWRYWHHPLTSRPDATQFGVLCYLTDTNETNGATEFVPGSHFNPLVQVDGTDTMLPRADSIRVDCKAGDVVFFDARVLHATGPNNSSEDRFAMTYWMFASREERQMLTFLPHVGIQQRPDIRPLFFPFVDRHRLWDMPISVLVTDERDLSWYSLAWRLSRRHYPAAAAEKNRDWTTLRDLINPGSLVFDVGANVGYWASAMSLRTGEGGRVIAFEPVCRNVALAHANLGLNRASNCEVVHCAITSPDIHAVWMKAEVATREGFGECELSPVATLDYMVDKYGVPDVIKIDVEGHEAHVLRGASKLIAMRRSTFIIEVHECERDEAGNWKGVDIRQHGATIADLNEMLLNDYWVYHDLGGEIIGKPEILHGGQWVAKPKH